jgi:hypothetical protein
VNVRVDHPDRVRRGTAPAGEQLEQHAGRASRRRPGRPRPVLEPLGRHVVERAEGGPSSVKRGPLVCPAAARAMPKSIK